MPGPNDAVPPLVIRLFGPFEVQVNGAPLPRLRTRKGEWLLALLVLRHSPLAAGEGLGGGVERRWLAGTLWPDSSERQAATSLRVSLVDLRRALGPEAGRLRSPTPRHLALDLAGAVADVCAFDAAIARGDPASLEGAVALYRGPLLEGCVEEWAFQERQVRVEAYFHALEVLAAHALADRRPEAAERYLRQAVGVDPLRESAQRALMQALAARGNYAAAVQTYRELRLLLHRELNAAPDPETTAVFQELRAAARRGAQEQLAGAPAPRRVLRASASRPKPPAGERTAYRGRGGRRLPPLAGLDSLLPPAPQDLRAGFPTPSPRVEFPNNLPHQLTRFIGRSRELEEAKQLLSQGRLVTLTGAGGCGKTRLALQLAAGEREAYADGVWFVELAALADPALMPQAVASVLGIREEPGRPLTMTLVETLLPKKLLLILDNCEHLLEACAALAEALLRRCPGVQIVATSRERLNLAGETTYRVPSLSTPGAEAFSRSGVQGRRGHPDLDFAGAERLNAQGCTLAEGKPERLTRYEAVRLFIDRAIAVVPAFAVTNANASAVAEICYRLDGIPLAIELAAARVRVLSAEEIAARLDDRFRLLTGGSRSAPPRQQTPRALIDWSYDLLSEPERLLLQRLSVFAGGWTLEAAEAVCGEAVDSGWWLVDRSDKELSSRDPGPAGLTTNHQPLSTNVLDLLTALVDKSLVADEPGAETRYRLLETIRQYSQERLLERGEAERVQERHCDWCLALAERAEPELRGPRQVEWLDRLEREHDNLRAALAWCVKAVDSGWWLVNSPVESGSETDRSLSELTTNHQPPSTAVEKGLRLGAALWPFWQMRSYIAEGREHLARLLAPRASPRGGEDPRSGGAGPRAAGAEVRTEALAGALQGAAMLAWWQWDHRAAREFLEESLAIFREAGNRSGVAWSLSMLGWTLPHLGEPEAARALGEQSLAMFRESGEKRGIAWSLNYLGCLARPKRDLRAARARFEESLALLRELGDQRGIGYVLGNLGEMQYDQGENEAARAVLEESLAIFRELGEKQGIAGSLRLLARVAQAQRDCEAARAFTEECMAIDRELGGQASVARSHLDLALQARLGEDYERAQSHYSQSLELFRDLGEMAGAALSLYGLGYVAYLQGQLDTARSLLQEALPTLRECGDKGNVGWTLAHLGEVVGAQGDYRTAEAFLEESLAVGREIGSEDHILYVRHKQGRLALHQGHGARARACFAELLRWRHQREEKRGVLEGIEGLGEVAVAQAQFARAARLLGAAERLREALGGAPLPPAERASRQRGVATLREALSGEAFAAFWTEGRAMPLAEAVALALDD